MILHHSQQGQGAPMLMIHCALARSEALARLAASFTADHRVTLVDLPGHGRSADFPPGGDVHSLTRDGVLALLEGPTHLVGHSFGATVALRIAVERPDLVSRLTLIEPVYFKAAEGQPGHALHEKSWEPIAAAFARGDMAQAASAFMEVWGGLPFGALPPRQQKMILRGLPLVVASSGAVHFDEGGVLAPGRLEGVRCPVRLIKGERSPPVIAEIQAALAARLPNAARSRVAGAGHMLALTHPRQVAEIIRADLA